jgi:IS605 OrfB family transposase
MEQTLTAKIQIYPTDSEALLFKQTMDAYRHACNYVSSYVFQTHNLSQPRVQEATYKALRGHFNLRSQMAISVVRTVIAKYKTIRENQKLKNKPVEWIEPLFRKPQLDLVWNRDYSLTKDGLFSVNTLEGRKKVTYAKNGMDVFFDGSWKFGTAKMTFKHGKWFLHVPCTKEIEEPNLFNVKNVVGVDLGMNFISTSYDSKGKTQFYAGRFMKDKRNHYKKIREQLQQVGTPSSRRRLKAIGQRENRWMHDVNHCVSKALVERAGKDSLIVLEDLTGIRNATEKHPKNNRYHAVSWAFYDLRKKIEYKAAKQGASVLPVNRIILLRPVRNAGILKHRTATSKPILLNAEPVVIKQTMTALLL